MVDPDIAAHYALGFESSRLFIDGRPRLEYIRTLELLDRHLPSPPGRIVDVGGGTGVYAVPLVERGFEVHVIEPIERHVHQVVETARQLNLRGLTAEPGDARDLSGVTEGADAVLLLGPLYHLTESSDRAVALTEALRIVRPGGVVVAVGISRFAYLIDGLKRTILDDPVFRPIVQRDLDSGQHRNPHVQTRPEFFTTAYFHRPEELRDEAFNAGLVDISLFAVEGPSWIVEDPADLDNQLFAARAVESEPALMGATSHLMMIGYRAASD
ncbi:MAG: class I SAM-dependent methyltransferase [Actinobacteria bacterium]|nr:class I SAM-dependent methyltransferase [Actinomycetota bacterium]